MNWLKRLLKRRALDEQLDKELSFHLDTLTADLVAQGIDPAEARRQARLTFGGPAQVAEETREARGTRWLEDLAHDLRYALRTLRQKPGFALTALLTLALGAGATTVMFSLIHGVLLEPLPYPEPDRLVSMRAVTERFGESGAFSFPNFRDLQRDSRRMTLGAMRYGGGTISAPGPAAYVDGQQLTAGVFRMLRVTLARGREFLPDEDKPGGPNVAIVSYNVWQQRYGGSEAVIGAELQFDGRRYTIVGVAPATFQDGAPADVYTPLGQNPMPALRNRAAPTIDVIGRLSDGATLDATNGELKAIASRLSQEYPETNRGVTFRVRPALDAFTAPVQATLWILLGAAAMVLLIACVNVASLLLARAVSRQRELAMRVALGAGRGRLIRQCLAESATLSLLGGLLGVALAYASLEPFLALWPGTLPRVEQVQLDWRVLAVSLGVSLACGLLFGVAPALRAPTRNLEEALRGSSKNLAGKSIAGGSRLHGVYVAAEVALAMVLLVSAGFLGRTMLRLSALDPGLKLENALAVRVAISPNVLNDAAGIRAQWDEVVETARRTPGVASATLTDIVPMRSGENALPYATTPNVGPSTQLPIALATAVTRDHLQVMGIPLLHGRFVDDRDRADAPPVTVVDEVMARRAFGRVNVVGERLWVAALGPTPVEIVGVVGHVRHWGLAADDQSRVRDQMYYPFAQVPDRLMRLFAGFMTLAVRTTVDPLTMTGPLQRELRSVAGDIVLYQPYSLEQLASLSLARQRFLLLLLGIFAGISLSLACIGLYGVLAYLTSQRVPEFGVRVALGASAARVMFLVLRQSSLLVGIGVAFGFAGSVAAVRLLETAVEGAEPAGTTTLVAMPVLLLLAALAASLGPAWRASRVDPLVALRQD